MTKQLRKQRRRGQKGFDFAPHFPVALLLLLLLLYCPIDCLIVVDPDRHNRCTSVVVLADTVVVFV